MSMSNTTKKSINDFDDILEHVGGWGRFQYLTTLVFFLFNIFLGYVHLSPIITLYTPPHNCRVPQLANMSMEERRWFAIPPDPNTAGDTDWVSTILFASAAFATRRLQSMPAV